MSIIDIIREAVQQKATYPVVGAGAVRGDSFSVEVAGPERVRTFKVSAEEFDYTKSAADYHEWMQAQPGSAKTTALPNYYCDTCAERLLQALTILRQLQDERTFAIQNYKSAGHDVAALEAEAAALSAAGEVVRLELEKVQGWELQPGGDTEEDKEISLGFARGWGKAWKKA